MVRCIASGSSDRPPCTQIVCLLGGSERRRSAGVSPGSVGSSEFWRFFVCLISRITTESFNSHDFVCKTLKAGPVFHVGLTDSICPLLSPGRRGPAWRVQDPSTLMRSLTGALRREGALVEEGRRLGQELDALQVPRATSMACRTSVTRSRRNTEHL